MNRCLIIYSSYHHGNTEKIARAMASAVNADLCSIDELAGKNIDSYDFLGFGSGIAYSKHYKNLLDAVDSLNLSGKNTFAFSTSGVGSEKSNTTLINLLKKNGAAVSGSFACKGFDTFGPFKLIGGVAKGHPDELDIQSAVNFIKGIVK